MHQPIQIQRLILPDIQLSHTHVQSETQMVNDVRQPELHAEERAVDVQNVSTPSCTPAQQTIPSLQHEESCRDHATGTLVWNPPVHPRQLATVNDEQVLDLRLEQLQLRLEQELDDAMEDEQRKLVTAGCTIAHQPPIHRLGPSSCPLAGGSSAAEDLSDSSMCGRQTYFIPSLHRQIASLPLRCRVGAYGFQCIHLGLNHGQFESVEYKLFAVIGQRRRFLSLSARRMASHNKLYSSAYLLYMRGLKAATIPAQWHAEDDPQRTRSFNWLNQTVHYTQRPLTLGSTHVVYGRHFSAFSSRCQRTLFPHPLISIWRQKRQRHLNAEFLQRYKSKHPKCQLWPCNHHLPTAMFRPGHNWRLSSHRKARPILIYSFDCL